MNKWSFWPILKKWYYEIIDTLKVLHFTIKFEGILKKKIPKSVCPEESLSDPIEDDTYGLDSTIYFKISEKSIFYLILILEWVELT